MFTIRNLGGVALFLFGTTYLWLTPMFASRGISTKGLWWSVTQVLTYSSTLSAPSVYSYCSPCQHLQAGLTAT